MNRGSISDNSVTDKEEQFVLRLGRDGLCCRDTGAVCAEENRGQ